MADSHIFGVPKVTRFANELVPLGLYFAVEISKNLGTTRQTLSD